MDYDNGFILQKTVVSTNRPVDWSLLRSSSARLLPKGRKNDGMAIQEPECATRQRYNKTENKR